MIDITEYIPKVERLARYFERKHGGFYGYEDLLSAGLYGLHDASLKFKSGDVPFWKYARIRVAGSIIDEVRFLSNSRRRGNHVQVEHLGDLSPEDFGIHTEEPDREELDVNLVKAAIAKYLLTTNETTTQVVNSIIYLGYTQRAIANIMGVTETAICIRWAAHRPRLINFVRQECGIQL